MSEIIAIMSGKGGTGKTVIAANIGYGLSKLHKKVVLVDTNIGLRNLDLILGLENLVLYNFNDVILKQCSLNQALIPCKQSEHLVLLSCAQTKDQTSINQEQMKSLMRDLKKEFDYVILDCPTDIGQGFQNIMAGITKAIVVTTPFVSSIRNTDRIIGLLRQKKILSIQCIVNQVRTDLVDQKVMMSVEEVMDLLPIDLLGVIPQEDSFLADSSKGKLVCGNDSYAGLALENICHRLLGENIPIINLETKKGTLWRFTKRFKNKRKECFL